jgi:hypothetical protein
MSTTLHHPNRATQTTQMIVNIFTPYSSHVPRPT